MYSNSKKGKKDAPHKPLQRRQSGDFDDFNTIAKKSKKLKYRKPKLNKSSRSISRSISRRKKHRRQFGDFYDKLSREFEDEDDSVENAYSGNSKREHNFQSNMHGQSKYIGRLI